MNEMEGVAMAQIPAGVSRLEDYDPEFLSDLVATAVDAFAPGALETKYKYLLAMALDAQSCHVGGVRSYARRAREAGATELEIMEVLRVLFYTGGRQSLDVGANALEQ
jgi:alkylhydroperoxidase/carboxymuconolactone decarboxylase family protein YurZ